MELKDSFNGYRREKLNANVLLVGNGVHFFYYDFAQRLMTTAVHHGGGATPFDQLDREVLVAMRDKLIELGGNPPALAPLASTPPGNARKLNP